ncbi:hypothetical protein AVEN_230220-1 [Araneus ventricosus]|uniref:Uncharacterized protein n=1 Tax=Araneus ventricosus TaxID=182803 RepID=A0A4Y2DY99_ARAVE|nr:hypothetical protein AVEN_230220-1 [Araneus ventricosus]
MVQISQGSTNVEENRIVKRGSTIRACGRNLVQTLSLFCNGEYYDPNEDSNVQARNIPFSMEDPFQNWIAVTLSSRYRNEAGSETISEQVPISHLSKRFGQGTVQSAGASVMVWDVCCWRVMGPLIRLETTLGYSVLKQPVRSPTLIHAYCAFRRIGTIPAGQCVTLSVGSCYQVATGTPF